MIQYGADAGCLPQRFGRGQPDRKGRKLDERGDAGHAGIGVADEALHAANAKTRAHKLPIDKLIVTADRKIFALTANAKPCHGAQDQVGPVKADELHGQKIRSRFRRTMPRDQVMGSIKRGRKVGQMARHDIVLCRSIHAQGNVSLAEVQAFGGV